MVGEHKSSMSGFNGCVVGLIDGSDDELSLPESHDRVETSWVHSEGI